MGECECERFACMWMHVHVWVNIHVCVFHNSPTLCLSVQRLVAVKRVHARM